MDWLGYVATGALVVIAWRAYLVSRALIEFMGSLPIVNANMVLNPQIVELLTNFRRNKPRAKKEIV